ncbi:16S rRNA processing protein RimM [candidate division KSB1 bacterium]|nr:MAG: 16S rRNA processing protein RimM [candidate division KSB1 bacterium]
MTTQTYDENDELITIGVVVKPHGVRGELKVFSHTDNPRRFYRLTRIFLTSADSGYQPYVVEKVRVVSKWVLLKLKGIDSQNQAERFRGFEVQIPRRECVKLPKGAYYIFEVIGLNVFNTEGQQIGTVADVYTLPSNDVLVVETTTKKEVLIPAVKQVVKRIDIHKKQIIVEPIPGLLEEQER